MSKKILFAASMSLGLLFAQVPQARANTCDKVFSDIIELTQIAEAEIRLAIQAELSLIHNDLYGADLTNPSPESKLGKYLTESGASVRLIQPSNNKDGTGGPGPAKLVVAVSERSLVAFKNAFMGINFMSVLGHANILFKEKVYSFGGGAAGDFRLPSVGTPLPIVILKQSEALRLNNYLDLTTKNEFRGWTNALKQPWLLPGYSAKGGYSCCTHHIGNIPIGDLLVNEYKFPANMENDTDKSPRAQKLRPYHAEGNNQFLKEIWKAPGHQQFADVLGQQEANLAGNFASPGWVIQTLIGPTTSERVPVIIYVTNDHTQPIPENVQSSFSFEATR